MLLGIDIGTTSLSLVVFDPARNAPVEVVNADSHAGLSPPQPGMYLQDPRRIWDMVSAACTDLQKRYSIERIGVTGQMHGILFLDGEGQPVSPLYTWQNESGEWPYRDGKSYREYLNAATGYAIPEHIAMGCLTHFFLQETASLPPDADKLCTIGDYVAMALCGKNTPVMHISNADGLGLFNSASMDLDRDAMGKIGLKPSLYPNVVGGYALAGHTSGGIPVAAAIGDNQASFLAAVGNRENGVLLNIGTSTQLSCLSKTKIDAPGIDSRAFLGDSFLAVCTSHCGGRAYAALERFFRQVLEFAGFSADGLYDIMNRSALGWAPSREDLRVNTAFRGTRFDPAQRGEISNITPENFTPEQLVHGFLQGIASEPLEAFSLFAQNHRFSTLTVSGNAIRKNPALQEIVAQVYDLPVRLAPFPEEAACGAALFAAKAAVGG